MADSWCGIRRVGTSCCRLSKPPALLTSISYATSDSLHNLRNDAWLCVAFSIGPLARRACWRAVADTARRFSCLGSFDWYRCEAWLLDGCAGRARSSSDGVDCSLHIDGTAANRSGRNPEKHIPPCNRQTVPWGVSLYA